MRRGNTWCTHSAKTNNYKGELEAKSIISRFLSALCMFPHKANYFNEIRCSSGGLLTLKFWCKSDPRALSESVIIVIIYITVKLELSPFAYTLFFYVPHY